MSEIPTEPYIFESKAITLDTGSPAANPYPSIFGTHNGTITPSQTITVNKLYTYPCAGTGGHTEYARIWNSTLNVNATWNGYVGDWHTDELEVVSGAGTITCNKFIDANGKIYTNWIPAIRLWAG